MNKIRQLQEIKNLHQSLTKEKGDKWDRNVVALEWAIRLIKEVQKERKRTFATRWQQATNELQKHKEIISNIPIAPKDPPDKEMGRQEKETYC